MGVYKFLLFSLLLPFLSSEATNDCQTSYCGQNFNAIRFPFRLIDQQPENCGYPGFNLRCVLQNTILINLPSAGDFVVRNMDYRHQSLQIYDPSNCLAAKLSKLNLSNTPFPASYYHNYTLLSCPSDANLFGVKPIGCLSNSSFLILATDSNTFATSMTSNESGCVVSGRLSVPVNQSYDDGLTSQLSDNITLTWGTPDCESCEANGSSCGYADITSQTITCLSNNTGDSASNGSSSIFRILAFAMAIPAMTASLVIACFTCLRFRREQHMISTITTATPEDTVEPSRVVGLDQATIESYTKVVLDDSKRLPGHADDAACPICLSDYNVKETVRCIPECQHCFHVDCIDDWLKKNGTCPICRNSLAVVHIES
ncbi:putative RING-H2 finger protein ATL21A [Rutidosis leptorrhynchoides]|uniref:putative RING-H2 finger protein ATL21A n=1 Tax=Rutidosis leptorrhynchoides TaxID=125765 RepID=UPI003A99E900